MRSDEVLISLRGVQKDYHGLRPLRVERLDVRKGETVALLGFDQAGAEVLVDLITAASLPDSGDVNIFGTPTRSITDPESWLRQLDHFGILSQRAVLLERLTTEQNLAIPYSLEIDALPAELHTEVVRLAEEVGLTPGELEQPVAALAPLAQARVRLGKALALRPRVLLAEHPNAGLPSPDIAIFAADMARVVERRGLAALVLTADGAFASAVAAQVLTLQPATGALKGASSWRRWFAQP